MTLHAEVKALQQQYGISYKDAAHRLYHSEITKLGSIDTAQRNLERLLRDLDDIIVYRNEAQVDDVAQQL